MKPKTKVRMSLYIREKALQDIKKAALINRRPVSNFMEYYSNIAAQTFLTKSEGYGAEKDAENNIMEATNEKIN